MVGGNREGHHGANRGFPIDRNDAVHDASHGENRGLRRDNNGRVYYVVSDADSGQEILEVPPKALRDVGQGIEDYLKGEQSKASSHVKVKA